MFAKKHNFYFRFCITIGGNDEIYEFDLKVFNSSRKYAVHTQPSIDENIDAENDPESAAMGSQHFFGQFAKPPILNPFAATV